MTREAQIGWETAHPDDVLQLAKNTIENRPLQNLAVIIIMADLAKRDATSFGQKELLDKITQAALKIGEQLHQINNVLANPDQLLPINYSYHHPIIDLALIRKEPK